MRSFWTKAITVLIIVAIAYVFISPALVLDPSANRAWRAAAQVMMMIALLAFTLCGFERPLVTAEWVSPIQEARGSPEVDEFSTVCLC